MAELVLRAVVAYDGTDFLGFQRQASGRTVQAVLENAFEQLYDRPVTVRGAGRTDAGVHARGQHIAVRVPDTIPPERVALAVRPYLPRDVAVRSTARATDGFDPRREALWRRYRYVLAEDAAPDPLRDRFATRVAPGLDRAAMLAATAPLIGRHDFRSLCCDNGCGGPTVRELMRAEWHAANERFELVLEAQSFLYKQVRCTVGVLLAVGRGRFDAGLTTRLLAGERRPVAVAVAPPQGLVLEAVGYPADSLEEA